MPKAKEYVVEDTLRQIALRLMQDIVPDSIKDLKPDEILIAAANLLSEFADLRWQSDGIRVPSPPSVELLPRDRSYPDDDKAKRFMRQWLEALDDDNTRRVCFLEGLLLQVLIERAIRRAHDEVKRRRLTQTASP